MSCSLLLLLQVDGGGGGDVVEGVVPCGCFLVRDLQAFHGRLHGVAEGGQRQHPERLLDHDADFLDVEEAGGADEGDGDGEPAAEAPEAEGEAQVPQGEDARRHARERQRDGRVEDALAGARDGLEVRHALIHRQPLPHRDAAAHEHLRDHLHACSAPLLAPISPTPVAALHHSTLHYTKKEII